MPIENSSNVRKEDQRVHDTFLLADLINLVQKDRIQYPSLDTACRQWLGIEIPKDEYRTSFESIVGQDWGQVDQGCFEYAATDAMATYQLYCRLTAEARQIVQQHGVSTRYGFLSESIQVKAAIVMDRIKQLGLHVNLELVKQLRHENEEQISALIEDLKTHYGLEVFHRYKKTGQRKPGPQMDTTVVAEKLQDIASQRGIDVPVPKQDGYGEL